jgi:penicillin-binding protein 1A
MARQVVYDRYQAETYTSGIKVYTTIRKGDQEAAYQALRKNVMNYDKRRGYRGPEGFIDLLKHGVNQEKALEDALEKITKSDGMYAAVVLTVNDSSVQVYRKGGKIISITQEGLELVQKFLANQSRTEKGSLRPGALVRIQKNEKDSWEIVQLPEVEAALVSINPQDGAIRALIGGFDFHHNQFNHVTQAWRQPGSSFKPFIYSASLDKGFTPATIINDAPLSFDASQTGSKLWEPRNFDGKYSGPIRMRVALAKSKNLASIRILQAIGLQYAQDYITRFGFEAERHPAYLPMALGSGSVTPMQMAAGYTVFANGGYQVTPYFIKRIEDKSGNILDTARPAIAGKDAHQIIDPRNAFLTTNMMQDVINRGTATRAKQLGRNDIAGKTGTTSNFIDAWFCGFQRHLVAVTWIGFDDPKSLGNNETGGRAALPMWMDYMDKALKNVPAENQPPPQGIITAKINPDTGLREKDGTITEHFFQEQLPPQAEVNFNDLSNTSETFRDQLF